MSRTTYIEVQMNKVRSNLGFYLIHFPRKVVIHMLEVLHKCLHHQVYILKGNNLYDNVNFWESVLRNVGKKNVYNT